MWAFKALAALAVLAIAALVARIAASRGVSPAPAAALVALNPLVLAHVAGGAHNDALMMLGLMGGVALVLAARDAAGGAAIAAAAAIKLPAAIAAPFAVIGAGGAPHRTRVLVGIVAAAGAIAATGLAVFGGSVADSLGFLSGSQQRASHHSVPATVGRGIGVDLDIVRIVFAAGFALLALWLVAWTARGGDWVRAAAWAMLALLCATVYVTPWYLIWALPLVAVARDRVLVVLTLALCAYQLPVAVP
jgi:alpha-1,6-mannosyltransferase